MEISRQRIADEVGGWVSELDACDGYVVLLGDPVQDAPLAALGPYDDLDALRAADLHQRCGGAAVRVVRLHHRGPGRAVGAHSGRPAP